LGGGNNGSNGGYRGIGYNPNFENADEYPPSQQHVEPNVQRTIDLSKFVDVLLSIQL
jgi:hypothetical protein